MFEMTANPQTWEKGDLMVFWINTKSGYDKTNARFFDWRMRLNCANCDCDNCDNFYQLWPIITILTNCDNYDQLWQLSTVVNFCDNYQQLWIFVPIMKNYDNTDHIASRGLSLTSCQSCLHRHYEYECYSNIYLMSGYCLTHRPQIGSTLLRVAIP